MKIKYKIKDNLKLKEDCYIQLNNLDEIYLILGNLWARGYCWRSGQPLSDVEFIKRHVDKYKPGWVLIHKEGGYVVSTIHGNRSVNDFSEYKNYKKLSIS